MNDKESRDEGRQFFAACAGGIVAMILFSIGAWAARNSAPHEEIAEIVVLIGLLSVIGAAVGAAGATRGSLNRASLTGAAVMGVLMIFEMFAQDPGPIKLGPGALFIAAGCALGSICAQVGWVVGGRAGNDPDRPKPGQFTIRQFLAFFIPVAVYFGYVRYLLQR